MAQTFGDVWRMTCLQVPSVDPATVRTWLMNGYRRLGDWKNWSFLRRSWELALKDARTGTADVTQYSDTVAPGTLTFSAADVGRQFRVGSSGLPITIIRFDGTNAILEYPYNGASASGTSCQILDAFPAMPSDFGHFIPFSVLDAANWWVIRTFFTEAELNRIDPQRSGTGTLRVLASRAIGSSDGLIRYEAWPYQTSAVRFPVLYYARPSDPGDLGYFGGPFRDRDDVLLLAALHQGSLSPGPADNKNPLFGADKTRNYKSLLDDELETLAGKDEDIYPTAIFPQGIGRWRWAPIDSNYAAEHDSMGGGVYGGFGYNYL